MLLLLVEGKCMGSTHEMSELIFKITPLAYSFAISFEEILSTS